ncbi:hypothetical protein DEIPH_ctg045orf0011 [Deinococcus phoenicis]|uniref:YspA cpYpsA-related SLOG domain-containing protein n=1 Tax=Deinococcus phoenicis TaxID=1476583 RepID=A0A016QN16_9DEIO|nr:hypothetical protein DEIPH_ctg045orf0011 [Deinococcus phoenicis]
MYGWPDEVVTGGASGADTMGKAWALENGIPHRGVPAEWERWGKKAGPLRNAEMARYACDGVRGGCLALPGGKGTADMVQQARTSGLTMMEVEANHEY